jgi:hypothetical protein
MTDNTAAPGSEGPSRINTKVPHSARVWNYLIGGEDNYAVDREAADYAVKVMPELVRSARANRQFLGRAVQFLAGEGAARTLDFTQPIAVVLSGIINFVVDDAEAHAVVNQFVSAVPSGSYLLMSHPTKEVNGPAVEESMRQWNASGAAPIRTRTVEEIRGFFDGLDLLDPGVVTCTAWRPDPRLPGDTEIITEVVSEFVAVGRKP